MEYTNYDSSWVEKPKQFVDVLGIGKTFIQLTYERFARFIPKENFFVITGENYKALVLEQLPMFTPNHFHGLSQYLDLWSGPGEPVGFTA